MKTASKEERLSFGGRWKIWTVACPVGVLLIAFLAGVGAQVEGWALPTIVASVTIAMLVLWTTQETPIGWIIIGWIPCSAVLLWRFPLLPGASFAASIGTGICLWLLFTKNPGE